MKLISEVFSIKQRRHQTGASQTFLTNSIPKMKKNQIGLDKFFIYTIYLGMVIGIVSLLYDRLPPFPGSVFVLGWFAILTGFIMTLLAAMIYFSSLNSTDKNQTANDLRGNWTLLLSGIAVIFFSAGIMVAMANFL